MTNSIYILPDERILCFTDLELFVLLLVFFCFLTQVVEFDEPSKLLANENSRFCAMLAAVENKISVRG